MTCQAMRCHRCVTHPPTTTASFIPQQQKNKKKKRQIYFILQIFFLAIRHNRRLFILFMADIFKYLLRLFRTVGLSVFWWIFFCHVLNVFELLLACPTLKDNFNIVNQMPQCRQQFSSGKLRSSSGRILCFIRACDLGYRN